MVDYYFLSLYEKNTTKEKRPYKEEKKKKMEEKMKKITQIFVLMLSFVYAEKIEFQSKLYITPSDDSKLEVITDTLLCVKGKHGLYSVDISNIKKPKILKNTPCIISSYQESEEEKELHKKWGNYQGVVYSSDKKTLFVFRDNHFTVVDVSVPSKDEILGDYELFKYENHMYISDILFSKDEKYAYVINSISGVQIYDISNKHKLKALGKLKKEIGTDDISDFYLIKDRYLYGRVDDYVIVDIKNKEEPKFINSNLLEGNEELYHFNENLFIVMQDNLCDAFTNFMKLLDVSNPLKPKIVQNITIKDYMYTLQISGNKIFFLGEKGLRVYSVN